MPLEARYLSWMGQYRYHVFVCTSGKTCPQQGSEMVHAALKRGVKQAGLKGLVRVNHAGCMNQCGHGPMVVVYPEDTWYAHVDTAGAQRIVAEHLIGGTPVEDYRYIAPPGDNKLESLAEPNE
jgi:(2Fe-2S) ferredoxin